MKYTSSLDLNNCSFERKDDLILGGKLWYNDSRALAGIELDLATCIHEKIY